MPREAQEIPAEPVPAGKLKCEVYRLPKVFSTTYFTVFSVNPLREWLCNSQGVTRKTQAHRITGPVCQRCRLSRQANSHIGQPFGNSRETC